MRFASLFAAAALLALPAVAQAQAYTPTDNTTNASGANRTQGTGDPNRGDPVNVRAVTCTSGTCTAVAPASSALQTTGNTSAATTATALGTPADTAWASGSGSVIAVLKNIATAALPTGTNSIGAVTATGNVADGVTDSGTPVKIGGRIVSGTVAAGTTGNRADATFDTVGNLRTLVGALSATPVDGGTTSVFYAINNKPASGSVPLGVLGYVWNGTTSSMSRGDTVGTYTVPTPTAATANAITPVVTSAVASSLVLKASAGNLYGLNIVSGASAGFVLVFNATSAPADGAVTPVRCYSIAANSTLTLGWQAMPAAFSTGITAVFSTTGCFSKTASATAFISGDVK